MYVNELNMVGLSVPTFIYKSPLLATYNEYISLAVGLSPVGNDFTYPNTCLLPVIPGVGNPVAIFILVPDTRGSAFTIQNEIILPHLSKK